MRPRGRRASAEPRRPSAPAHPRYGGRSRWPPEWWQRRRRRLGRPPSQQAQRRPAPASVGRGLAPPGGPGLTVAARRPGLAASSSAGAERHSARHWLGHLSSPPPKGAPETLEVGTHLIPIGRQRQVRSSHVVNEVLSRAKVALMRLGANPRITQPSQAPIGRCDGQPGLRPCPSLRRDGASAGFWADGAKPKAARAPVASSQAEKLRATLLSCLLLDRCFESDPTLTMLSRRRRKAG